MTQAFQTIGLIGKPGDSNVAATLTTLSSDLSKRGCEVVLDTSAAA